MDEPVELESVEEMVEWLAAQPIPLVIWWNWLACTGQAAIA
jgi:hypothetical protein